MNEHILEATDVINENTELFTNENKGNFRMTMDWVFRTVYGSDTKMSNAALVAFLNIIIGDKENPITDVTILNPIDLKDSADMKSTVMDIKAKTQKGEYIDIEMQTYGYSYYPNRALVYAGKLIVSQLDESDNYDKMKPSIVISIIEGRLIQDNDDVYNRYDIRNSVDGSLMTNLVQFHFLELGKVSGTPDPATMTDREVLAAYLKYTGDNAKKDYLNSLLDREQEVVLMSEILFEKLSEDKRAQMIKDREQMDRININTMKSRAEEDGFARGIVKEREASIIKTVRMLKGLGLSDAEISRTMRSEYDISDQEMEELLR